MSATVGIRELRQDASELLRRAEAGEEITVTVAGRPSVRLVGVANEPNYWRTWEQVAGAFAGPPIDQDAWNADRDQIDDSLEDPWSRQRQDQTT